MATTRSGKVTKKQRICQVTLAFERETKNTVRYSTDDEDAAVNPLYIQKSAIKGDVPESVTITVEG